MAYTANNVQSIKAGGNLENYIAMERKLISSLEAGELQEVRFDNGYMQMSFAHLVGTYYAAEDRDNGPGGTYLAEARASFDDFRKEWSNFATMNAATAYARAALRNHITETAANVLVEAKERLATLEAAQ